MIESKKAKPKPHTAHIAPVDELVSVLTIPGLKAELTFNGSEFSLTGTTDGDAYALVNEALKKIRNQKQNKGN
jgi:hypothetical protein